MTDNESYSYSERLLGRILAEAGADQAGDDPAGEAVSDEGLLQLAQQLAKSGASAAQREQTMKALLGNPDLYERWVALSGLITETPAAQADMQASPKPVQMPASNWPTAGTHRRQRSRRLQWLAGLVPAPVWGTALGLLVGVVSAGLFFGTSPPADNQAGNPVVAQQGVPLPARASRERADGEKAGSEAAGGVSAGLDTAAVLGAAIRCLAISESNSGSLCYSDTSDNQHWFQVSLMADGKRNILARPPLLETDRIDSVTPSGNLLLIEHRREGLFRLSLLKVDMNTQAPGQETLFEDTAAQGYFEEIDFDGETLNYVLRSGDRAQSKTFRVK